MNRFGVGEWLKLRLKRLMNMQGIPATQRELKKEGWDSKYDPQTRDIQNKNKGNGRPNINEGEEGPFVFWFFPPFFWLHARCNLFRVPSNRGKQVHSDPLRVDSAGGRREEVRDGPMGQEKGEAGPGKLKGGRGALAGSLELGRPGPVRGDPRF